MQARTQQNRVIDLLSLALFQLDPRVNSSKEALWRSLVETALYYAEKQLSQEEIAKAIAFLLEQPELNIVSYIQTAVESCVEKDSLARQDVAFVLTERGSAHIKAMVLQRELDEKVFDVSLAQRVEEEIGFTLSDRVILCTAVKHVLQEMFHSKGVEIQRLLDRNSFSLDEVLQTGRQYDPIGMIKENLKPVMTLIGKEAEEKTIAGIRKHFQNLDEGSKRYVALLYNKVFYHQILNLDPNLHAHQREYFKVTRIYLDTNVLLAYLFDGDSRHRVTAEVIDASKRIGLQIIISPVTLREMNRVIDRACQLHSSLGDDKRITRLLTDTSLGQASNPILVTFAIKHKENSGLIWDNFIIPYRKLEDLLLQKEILVEDELYDGIRNDADYSKVWNTIREIGFEKYPGSIIYHDADNFMLIHRLRNIHEPHTMGQTVWLLSYDSNLCTAERRLRNVYPIPHCHMLDDWGQIILPYQNINNFAFDDYILYLVRSSLGITMDMDGLDLDFLESLHRPEFDIDSVLQLDDPNYVAKILADMQVNKEIRELAERARTAQTPEELTQINRQLAPRLFEIVSNDKKEAEETADRLIRRVQELENKLHKIETRTFWQRLKALLGLK